MMKKMYSVLAAGALLFAGAAQAQSIVGSHDVALIPVFVNDNYDIGEHGTFGAQFDAEGMLIAESSMFFIHYALMQAQGTNNEIPGGYANFFRSSFVETGLSGWSYNSAIDLADLQDNLVDYSSIGGQYGIGVGLQTFPNAAMLVDQDDNELRHPGHVDDYTLAADSIFHVIDMDLIGTTELDDAIITVADQALEYNEVYGIFYYFAGVMNQDGAGEWTIFYEDVNPDNDLVVVPFRWVEEGEGTTDGGVSVEEMILDAAKTHLYVFPNPAQDMISFDHHFAQKSENVTINVLDITGKVVYTQNEGTPTTVSNRYSVNVENLAAGTYIVQLVTDNYTSTSKFVKK